MPTARMIPGIMLCLLSSPAPATAATLVEHQALATSGHYNVHNGYTGDLTLLAKPQPAAIAFTSARTPLLPALGRPLVNTTAAGKAEVFRFDSRVPATVNGLPLFLAPKESPTAPVFYRPAPVKK